MKRCVFPKYPHLKDTIACDLRVLPTGLPSQPIALMLSAIRTDPLPEPGITNTFEDLATALWATQFSGHDP